MRVRSGRYRTSGGRIEIHELIETEDTETGQLVKTYNKIASPHAEVRYQPGRERLLGGKSDPVAEESAQSIIMVTMRYRSDLSVKSHKIKYNNHLWDITSIRADGIRNRQYLELTCELLNADEVVNG